MNPINLEEFAFNVAGEICLANDRLRFNLLPPFLVGGEHAQDVCWVYLWVKMNTDPPESQVCYVGKAGKTMMDRCRAHTSGFVRSVTGRRHAARIREFLAGSDQRRLKVYARKSLDGDLLGENGISLCEAEERAMIAKCRRFDVNLWNAN